MEDEKTKWERYSATVSPDLKGRLDARRDQTGLKHEDFLNQMLAAFESQLDSPGSSMESKEMNQVRQNLRNVEAVVLSAITLAKDKADQSLQTVNDLRNTHAEEISSVKAKLQVLTQEKERLESENETLLKDQESREALKQAWDEQKAGWQEKEQVYKNQIADMSLKIQTLPKELEQKKTDLAKAEKEITSLNNETATLRHQNELELQKAKTELQKALTERTDALRKEFDEKLNTVRMNEQTRAKEGLEQERKSAKERLKELSDQYESQIHNLSDQVKQYQGIIDNMTNADKERTKEYYERIKDYDNRIAELSKNQGSKTKKSK